MKIKDGYILKEVAGNYIVIAGGEEALDFNSIITVNELGALIWRKLEEGKAKEEIIEDILAEYDVDKDTASADFDEFINVLKEKNICKE